MKTRWNSLESRLQNFAEAVNLPESPAVLPEEVRREVAIIKNRKPMAGNLTQGANSHRQ